MSKKIIFMTLISLSSFVFDAAKAAEEAGAGSSAVDGLSTTKGSCSTHGTIISILTAEKVDVSGAIIAVDRLKSSVIIVEERLRVARGEIREKDEALKTVNGLATERLNEITGLRRELETLRTGKSTVDGLLEGKEAEVTRLNEQIVNDSWNLRPGTVVCVGVGCAFGGALLATAWGNREALQEMIKGVRVSDIVPPSGT